MAGAREEVVAAMAACAGMRGFRQILARVLTMGMWRDSFVVARAIAFCATSAVAGGLDLAEILFLHADDTTAFAFNAMIRGHSAGPTPSKAVILFRRMLKRGIYPDKFTFPFVLRALARAAPPGESTSGAEQHHVLLLKYGLAQDLHVQTSLLHTYASLRCISQARQVFDEMPEKGVVTWNAIISAYGKISETPLAGVVLFRQMARDKVEFNDDTFVAALQCCAAAGSFVNGKSLHGFMIHRCGNPWPVEVSSSLLRMYVKCGSLGGAKKTFETMATRDVSAWTVMIGGLAEHGQGAAALRLFQTMTATEEGLRPDAMTFSSLLHACSHSGLVLEGLKLFREMASTYGVEPRVEHYGAMVDLLGRAGMAEEARQLAASMPLVPNQVVRKSLLWTLLNDGDQQAELVLDVGEPSVEVSNALARRGRWDLVERSRTAMAEMGLKKAPACSSVDVFLAGRPRSFLAGDTADLDVMAVCVALGTAITAEQEACPIVKIRAENRLVNGWCT